MNVKIVSEAKADFANLLTYYVNVGNYEGNYDLARRFEAEILGQHQRLWNRLIF